MTAEASGGNKRKYYKTGDQANVGHSIIRL